MKYQDTKLPEKPELKKAFEIGYQTCLDMYGGQEDMAAEAYRSENLLILDALRQVGDEVSEGVLGGVLLGIPGLQKVASAPAQYEKELGADIVAFAQDMAENPVSSPEEMEKASIGKKQTLVALMTVNMEKMILPAIQKQQITLDEWQSHKTELLGLARAAKGAAPTLDQKLEGYIAQVATALNDTTEMKPKPQYKAPKNPKM